MPNNGTQLAASQLGRRKQRGAPGAGRYKARKEHG